VNVWGPCEHPSRVEGFCSGCGVSLGVDTSGQPAEWFAALSAHQKESGCTGHQVELQATFVPVTEAAE